MNGRHAGRYTGVTGAGPRGGSAVDSGHMARSIGGVTVSGAASGAASGADAVEACTHAALRVRVVTDVAGLDALGADWERLAASDAAAGVFNGWPWNRTWWRHYDNLGTLHVIVIERIARAGAIDRIVAIAPFYHARPRMLGVFRPATLRFLGTGGDTAPDDVDMIVEPAHAVAAAGLVAAHLFEGAGVRRLLLEHMPARSPLLDAVERRWRRRRVGHPVRAVEHRWVSRLPSTVEAWRASLSRNSRKHLTRRRRRAAGLGLVEYDRVTGDAALDEAFAELVRLHRARHASRGEEGSFATDAYNGFHRELMGRLLERGELVLVRLRLDGCTIGVEYAFRIGDTVAFFQTGFDPALEIASPGHLLMSHVIETGIESGVRTADFLRGDYPYKASYADARRENVTLDGPVRAVPFSPVRLAASRQAARRRGETSRDRSGSTGIDPADDR